MNVHEGSFYENKGKYKGILAWITSTDHKRIGLLYLYSIMTMFIVAALLGLAMKIELIAPGKTIMDAKTYNGFFTLHGITMVFLVVIPGIPAILGNFMLPLMIGAKDVAFPGLTFFHGGCMFWEPLWRFLHSLWAADLPIQAGRFMLPIVSGR